LGINGAPAFDYKTGEVMRKVFLFSMLLLLGLAGSQWLPGSIGEAYSVVGDFVRFLTMAALSFIMIRVGYEFNIDKSRLSKYGWDYVVAFTAASLPWIFVALYFVFILLPPGTWETAAAWKETLLAGRFAAPTSAGVLFSMFAAAGLSATWLFHKARILAIFDDLDTVLLMIPLKMLMVGLAWQLGMIMFMIVAMLSVAYVFLHKFRIPVTWPWVLFYALIITGASELIYYGSQITDESVPVHVEVLLPAFVLGCVIAYPKRHADAAESLDTKEDYEIINTAAERRVSTIVAAAFMLLVGLSMPMIPNVRSTSVEQPASKSLESTLRGAGVPASENAAGDIGSTQQIGRISAAQPPMGWKQIILHVILITFLANLGKMFPAFCYRREAHWRERLAVAIGMWPRGEVGAGVLVLSVSYGIGGPLVTVAMLSLALNLLLSGVFILMAKQLTNVLPEYG
jgi:Kef-type K+ transport system membrane component KefB